MTLEEIERIASSEVVFAILFIVFFVWFLRKYNAENEAARAEAAAQRIADIERDREIAREHKEREDALKIMLEHQRLDSLAREAELTVNMRKMVDQQERIGDTLQEVSTGLAELEKKVDNNVLEIWKVMATNPPGQPPTK